MKSLAPKKSQHNPSLEVFRESDLILPHLRLPFPTKIKIELDEQYVRLYVGRRDWEWDRKTGKLAGCGTVINGRFRMTTKKGKTTRKLAALKSATSA